MRPGSTQASRAAPAADPPSRSGSSSGTSCGRARRTRRRSAAASRSAGAARAYPRRARRSAATRVVSAASSKRSSTRRASTSGAPRSHGCRATRRGSTRAPSSDFGFSATSYDSDSENPRLAINWVRHDTAAARREGGLASLGLDSFSKAPSAVHVSFACLLLTTSLGRRRKAVNSPCCCCSISHIRHFFGHVPILSYWLKEVACANIQSLERYSQKKTKPKNILRRRGGSRPDAGIPRPRRWRIGGRNVTLKS